MRLLLSTILVIALLPFQSLAEPPLEKIRGNDWVGCTTKEELNQVTRYAVQKDNEAFSRALSNGRKKGTLTMFNHGEEVYVMDVEMFSGLVQVRRKGKTITYWTPFKAIQK